MLLSNNRRQKPVIKSYSLIDCTRLLTSTAVFKHSPLDGLQYYKHTHSFKTHNVQSFKDIYYLSLKYSLFLPKRYTS